MKINTKILITVIMSAIILTIIPVNTNAATLGQVKSLKTKMHYKTYMGYTSAKQKKPQKIKYKYGIKATWKKVNGASGYEVYVYGVASKKWRKIKTTKKTSYTFTNMIKKDKFKFKVRAYKTTENGKVYGTYSNSKTIHATYPMSKKRNGHLAKNYYDRYAAEQAFALQNKYRKQAGVKKLVWSETLYELCQERMKTVKYTYSHDGFLTTGAKFFKERYGYDDPAIEIDNTSEYGNGKIEIHMFANGENLAMGQSNYQEVMEAWKSSKGHYANLTSEDAVSGAIVCYRMRTKIMWIAIFGQTDLDKLLNR